MKILALKATNVLNLKAVEITPKGDVVVLSGKNEAGKSAVLNSICMALTGKSCDEPIRKGEEKAEVVVETGRFTIRRVWTGKNSRVEVYKTDEDGRKAAYGSPQALLNEVIGSLSFDPLNFKNLGKSEQKRLLSEAVGLDLTDLDEKRAELYEERKVQNRQLKQAEGALALEAAPPQDAPTATLSIEVLMDKLAKLEQGRAETVARDEKIRHLAAEAMRIKKEIDAKIAELEAIEKNLKAVRETNAPEEITEERIAAVKDQIKAADLNNRLYREAEDYRKKQARIQAEKDMVEELTEQIKATDQERLKRIEACKYPIDGLSVDEDGVLFDGVPFAQLSSGRQIRVSTAIAMALNPKLKVIFIRDASLLDEEGIRSIVEQAEGYQLWIEKVDGSGRVGIYIEDGEIKAVNQQ